MVSTATALKRHTPKLLAVRTAQLKAGPGALIAKQKVHGVYCFNPIVPATMRRSVPKLERLRWNADPKAHFHSKPLLPDDEVLQWTRLQCFMIHHRNSDKFENMTLPQQVRVAKFWLKDEEESHGGITRIRKLHERYNGEYKATLKLLAQEDAIKREHRLNFVYVGAPAHLLLGNNISRKQFPRALRCYLTYRHFTDPLEDAIDVAPMPTPSHGLQRPGAKRSARDGWYFDTTTIRYMDHRNPRKRLPRTAVKEWWRQRVLDFAELDLEQQVMFIIREHEDKAWRDVNSPGALFRRYCYIRFRQPDMHALVKKDPNAAQRQLAKEYHAMSGEDVKELLMVRDHEAQFPFFADSDAYW